MQSTVLQSTNYTVLQSTVLQSTASSLQSCNLLVIVIGPRIGVVTTGAPRPASQPPARLVEFWRGRRQRRQPVKCAAAGLSPGLERRARPLITSCQRHAKKVLDSAVGLARSTPGGVGGFLSLYIPHIFPSFVPYIFPCVFLNLWSQEQVRT